MKMMNLSKKLLVLLTLSGLAACAPRPEAASSRIGISEVQIERTARTLSIVARDARGATLGELSLVLGTFTNTELGEGVLDGRTLEIDVRGRAAQHQSIGTSALRLPLPTDAASADFNAFLLEARVNAELSRWGIGFQPGIAPTLDEQPYYGCDPAPNPSCGATDCFQQTSGGNPRYQEVCCGGSGQAVQRACTGLAGAGQNTACGISGTFGCGICWARTTSYCAISPAGAIFDDASCSSIGQYCDYDAECCGTSTVCRFIDGQNRCTSMFY